MRLSFIIAAGTILTALTAHAADGGRPMPQALLTAMQSGKAEVRFLVSEHGMDGWAIKNSRGDVNIVWTTADGTRLLQETPLTKERFDQLAQYQAQAVTVFGPTQAPAAEVASAPADTRPSLDDSRPKVLTAEDLWNDLQQAAGIQFGEVAPGRPQILMIAEPTCPFCRQMFLDLKPALDAGRISLKVVVVAPLNSVTEGMAAGLLALPAHQARDQWSDLMRGILPSGAYGAAEQASFDALRANAGLYYKWNIKGTPFTVYRTNSGIRVVTGRPSSVDGVLASLK